MSWLSIYAAIALIAGAAGSAGAWQVQAWRYAAKDVVRIEQQAELARHDRKAAQAASEGFEYDKIKTEIKYRTITREVARIVDRPVYRNVCFEHDGLRAIREALGAAGHPGELVGTVP